MMMMMILSNDSDDELRNNIINNKKVTTTTTLDDSNLKMRKRMSGVGTVVVAVERERRASQHALKWAVDRLLSCRDSSSLLTLLHVRHSAPLVSFNYAYHDTNMAIEREPDDQELEMLRSFRGFCARRQVKFEIVVVEDDDVAQALVDYAIRHRVENLLLGAPSRNGFSRLFNHGCGIASAVLKWIPNFCNVYIISKLGKPNRVRNASTSPIPPLHHIHHPNSNHNIMALSRRRGRTMSELDTGMLNAVISEAKIESSFPSPATSAPSTDGAAYLSLYEQVESCSATSPGHNEPIELCQVTPDHQVQDLCLLHPSTSSSHECKGVSQLLLTQKLESMEEDMKRLKFGAKAKEEHVLQRSHSLKSKLI